MADHTSAHNSADHLPESTEQHGWAQDLDFEVLAYCNNHMDQNVEAFVPNQDHIHSSEAYVVEDNRRSWEVCNVNHETGMVHHDDNCMALNGAHEYHVNHPIEADHRVLVVGKQASYNYQNSVMALYPDT